tara:strand:+ start:2117 stop:2344 length:228 start_codon:yes stop_codon:yes gene_type:complete
MNKWLKNKAKIIAIEISSNTTNGLQTLEEFAEYTGRKDAEDVLYFIFKGIVEHTKYYKDNPKIADQLNELRYRNE